MEKVWDLRVAAKGGNPLLIVLVCLIVTTVCACGRRLCEVGWSAYETGVGDRTPVQYVVLTRIIVSIRSGVYIRVYPTVLPDRTYVTPR
jgi:hypothetical protein